MKPGTGIWFAVGGLFALLGCAWTAMFFFAGRAKIERVELPPAAVQTETR
jgi:hypothetical protein